MKPIKTNIIKLKTKEDLWGSESLLLIIGEYTREYKEKKSNDYYAYYNIYNSEKQLLGEMSYTYGNGENGSCTSMDFTPEKTTEVIWVEN